jgi:dethiobiotin synthetase
MRGLFITGTDTGVGKTEVTAGIARIWRREGRAFRVCKPVATGGDDDARKVALAAGDEARAVTSLLFPEPAAPPVAARLAGYELTLARIIEAVRASQKRSADTLLVEGVGGLLCPLTETETVADLAAALGLPLVIVARRSLGTLNHTLMTVEIAHNRGLNVAGIVVSETQPVTTAAEQSNVEELRKRLTVPVLAVVPHRPGGYDSEIVALGEVDWWSLSG